MLTGGMQTHILRMFTWCTTSKDRYLLSLIHICFSKLKLIKNFLRSTTTQNRLKGLAILAIEHELADQVNLKDVIKKFAELKVRKKGFL